MNQQTSNQQRNQQHQQKQKPHHDQSNRQQPHPPAATEPTQAQIYDNLRRIGELEDKKLSIQNEIESCTVKLQGALNHVSPDSLLYKMLSSVLGKAKQQSATATSRGPKASSRKKASTKKTSSPKRATKKSTSSKKKTKKRASRKKRR